MAFLPICIFCNSDNVDLGPEEGEATLKLAYDKGGDAYLILGEKNTNLELHNEFCREQSATLEDAVLDNLE